MKKLKYILPCAGIMMLAACGDDSSSATSGEKYILDEANQKFALIYDRCYTDENTTRWDEYVDTTWFHYKFIGDTLIVIRDGNTADGYSKDDDDEYVHDEGDVYVGGSAGSIFGTWKTTKERCYYEDGEIGCRDSEGESDNETIFILDASKSNLTMSWELEKSYCPAEDLEFKLEDVVFHDLDKKDYSITRSGCNTVKFKVNGKSVTATASASIGKDNVAINEVTYTSGDKTCQYVFKKVHKVLQIPESLCNVNDMSKYMKKEADYPHKYQINNEDEFIPCLSEMLGMEVEY